MITVSHVTKTYRVARRNAGFRAAAKALFAREYETVRALDDLSFTVGDGEIVGYIGPNGAGKSTTIKVMSGILTPDSGSCVINGYVPWKQRKEHVAHIGVVFGQRSQLYWDVPVLDTFELLKDIYSVPNSVYKKNLDELISVLELEKIVRTPARQLSLGQRMRCEIAASLLHEPKVLFLDEPTIGLDAVSKIAVRNFIRQRSGDHGTTVILTTHDMQDIEAIASRIMLIGRGKILLDGTLPDLKQRYGAARELTVEYSGTPGALLPGVTVQQTMPGRMVLQVDTGITSVSAVIAQLSRQVEITDFSVSSQSAEELVVALYKELQL